MYTLKTTYKKILADTITPVSVYLKIRDKFPNSVLLESSDYHSKEESYSFICIEPIVSMRVENHEFTANYEGREVMSESVDGNFYDVFAKFTSSIDLECDESLKSFNGLYGYTTYDSVQYFENIKLNVRQSTKFPARS